jgi:uncharacterized protein (UPF0261 family)
MLVIVTNAPRLNSFQHILGLALGRHSELDGSLERSIGATVPATCECVSSQHGLRVCTPNESIREVAMHVHEGTDDAAEGLAASMAGAARAARALAADAGADADVAAGAIAGGGDGTPSGGGDARQRHVRQLPLRPPHLLLSELAQACCSPACPSR